MGPNNMPPGAEAVPAVFFLFYGLFMLAMLVLTVVVAWRIVGKMGYPGPLGLLALVPLLNIVLALYLAFSEWPIERELRASRSGSVPPGEMPPPVR